MAANGISTADKATRANLKLALSDTIRSTALSTVVDNTVVWTHQIYTPESLTVPANATKWIANVVVLLNSYINVDGVYYKCTTAGTTGPTSPTWIADFGYRPLNTIDPAQVNPPRTTPLPLGRPWV